MARRFGRACALGIVVALLAANLVVAEQAGGIKTADTSTDFWDARTYGRIPPPL